PAPYQIYRHRATRDSSRHAHAFSFSFPSYAQRAAIEALAIRGAIPPAARLRRSAAEPAYAASATARAISDTAIPGPGPASTTVPAALDPPQSQTLHPLLSQQPRRDHRECERSSVPVPARHTPRTRYPPPPREYARRCRPAPPLPVIRQTSPRCARRGTAPPPA